MLTTHIIMGKCKISINYISIIVDISKFRLPPLIILKGISLVKKCYKCAFAILLENQLNLLTINLLYDKIFL